MTPNGCHFFDDFAKELPVQQGLIDQSLIGKNHFFQRRLEVLQIPLQNQGNLVADKTGQNEAICFQHGSIQKRQQNLIFFPQKINALIHHRYHQIVPDDNIQKAFFFLPESQIGGDNNGYRSIFGNVGGQVQNAGMKLSADNGPKAAVLIRKVIVKRLPGNIQLVTQVRNADGRIRPLEEIFVQAFFDLLLTAIGGGGAGNLNMIH